MNTNRNVAFRTIGLVAAGFLAVVISTAPANAASTTSSHSTSVHMSDTGWDRK